MDTSPRPRTSRAATCRTRLTELAPDRHTSGRLVAELTTAHLVSVAEPFNLLAEAVRLRVLNALREGPLRADPLTPAAGRSDR